MKNKRKNLTKKTRFEVFKRDSFKCQYCGKSAPEVVLVVDHIIPVSKGGDNNIINLITSCEECNQGKSNRMLSDQSVLAKQRSQLEEINIRREQIKMMAEWRQGLRDIEDEKISIIGDEFSALTDNQWCFNDSIRAYLKKTTHKYEIEFVLECLRIACEQYIQIENGQYTAESARKAIEKLPNICKYKLREKNEPGYAELSHLTNYYYKFQNYGSSKSRGVIFSVFKKAYDDGVSVEDLWGAAKTFGTVYQLAQALGVNYY